MRGFMLSLAPRFTVPFKLRPRLFAHEAPGVLKGVGSEHCNISFRFLPLSDASRQGPRRGVTNAIIGKDRLQIIAGHIANTAGSLPIGRHPRRVIPGSNIVKGILKLRGGVGECTKIHGYSFYGNASKEWNQPP